MVAVWGDEGLDMPLTVPGTAGAVPLFPTSEQAEWLKEVVNTKQRRNWDKIDRLVAAVRQMDEVDDDEADEEEHHEEDEGRGFSCSQCGHLNRRRSVPRSYDLVGDIAILNSVPEGYEIGSERLADLAKKIIATNPSRIKLCCVRTGALVGEEKSAPVRVLAGKPRPILRTTHREHGVTFIVDVGNSFFTPRMSLERLRVCNQVGRGERIAVLFAGCGPEVLTIAAKTEASSVLGIEMNPSAAACMRRGVEMLSCINGRPHQPEAAEKITVEEGDVAAVLPTLPRGCFDRILAPRPKGAEAGVDGGGGGGGVEFLDALLPTLRSGGECHWYDFASKAELPSCERTRSFVVEACSRNGLRAEILYVGPAGKKQIAMLQFRICIDFRVHADGEEAQRVHGSNVVTERMMASTSKRQGMVPQQLAASCDHP